jgi:hypothetical protein
VTSIVICIVIGIVILSLIWKFAKKLFKLALIIVLAALIFALAKGYIPNFNLF